MIIRKKLEKLSKISEKGWKLLVALMDDLKQFVYDNLFVNTWWSLKKKTSGKTTQSCTFPCEQIGEGGGAYAWIKIFVRGRRGGGIIYQGRCQDENLPEAKI